MHLYSELRKTQAEVDKRVTVKQAAGYLSASPNHMMTPVQVAEYKQTAGLWTGQEAKEYLKQRATDRPDAHNLGTKVNEQKTKECWEHAIHEEAKTVTPEQVAERYRALGREKEAAAFELKQRAYEQMPEHGHERGQHRQESAVAVINLEVRRRARDMQVQIEQQRINDMAKHGHSNEHEQTHGKKR